MVFPSKMTGGEVGVGGASWMMDGDASDIHRK